MITDGSLPDFDLLWDYDRPAETERAFRDVLAATQAVDDPAYKAALLTQIARTQGLQRQFDAAHRTLDAAEALLGPDMARPRIRALLERGRVFNSSKDPSRARTLFLQAWQLAVESREDALAVDTAHMLGIVEPAEGDESQSWNQRALELAERSPDPRARRWRGSLYNNMGWTYHAMGRYDEALDFFNAALACRREQGQEQAIRIATWCVARCLRSLDRFEEALQLQRDLLAQSEAAGEAAGFGHEEVAECLLALGRPEEARPFFARAHALLSADAGFAEEEGPRLQRLAALAAPVTRPSS